MMTIQELNTKNTQYWCTILFLVAAVSSCNGNHGTSREMEQEASHIPTSETQNMAISEQHELEVAHNPHDTGASNAERSNQTGTLDANSTLGQDAIFHNVRSYLDRREVARLASTSKAINKVSYETTRRLDFSTDRANGYRSVTDAQLGILLPKYRSHGEQSNRVEQLNLAHCTRITDTGLQDIAQHCNQLTALDLRRCFNLTDTGLQAIAQHCQQLTALNLSACFNLTDTGLQAIAQHCPQLHVWR